MGVLDTGAFVIGGGFDIFDKVKGIGFLLRTAIEATPEDEFRIEFNPGGGLFQLAPQMSGGKQDFLDQLAECDQKLDEVCLTYQRIMENAPDLADVPDSREIGEEAKRQHSQSNGLIGDIDAILIALADYKARQVA